MVSRPGRHAKSRSAFLVGAGLVLLALGVFAYLLLDSQSRVHQESEKRFQTRAVVSAALTESLFGSAAGQQQQAAAKAFGGRAPDKAALAKLVKRSRFEYALILGSEGRALAASPGTPGSVRRRAGIPQHIREGLDGRPYLSGLLPGANGSGVIEWALPFNTRFGRRVEVVGMNATQLRVFVGSYLAKGRESSKMHAYLVDGTKHVIANAAGAAGAPGRLDAKLSGALSDRQGKYGHGEAERYFASAPVGGSSWRVVVSEPTSVLYPLLATGRRWVLWGMFAAFALAALASLVLFRRVLRSAAQLAGANSQLTRRQDALALANQSLEDQTRLARQASRAKSDFLANMSHELRTPLNSIIGFSELMMSGKAGETEAERKEYLGHIITSGRHLEQLINDILDLSKVEAGKMEFHPERADLVGLIGDLVSTMRVLAEKKQIEIAIEVVPDVRSVVVDRARLKQVLYNYLSNAIKFTPERGRVTVRVEPEGSESFRLVVADTGVGIGAEDQQKLFREFQQLDQTVQKEHQGTGLGLALVKRIVEAQDGSVGVQSEPGQGSVFYAVLPREPRQAERIPAGLLPLAHSNGGPTVLVVEDDRHDQALLERLLSSAGYVVDVVRTGADAVARSHERHFDAVILDLILPDVSGFDVLRRIRATGKNPTVPTIVVTMMAEKGLEKAFAVNDWLVKPVDPSDLLTSLERVVGTNDHGTVLVVDDDPASLKLAKATIKQLGCRVVCAPGGEEGLEAAAKHRPLAAIVLDLLMPGVDGFQFLDRLRDDADSEQTPVIVWTSKDLTPADWATLRKSTQGIVGKAQQDARLVDELRRCLEQSGFASAEEPNGQARVTEARDEVAGGR
jgi:signal transduction histidine kinase/DNA-binding response OmpR family regulator